MKLWSKTLIASAVCLILAGCDDSSKVDANLDKAKDNAQQIKEAASDKAEAIKDQADKHIDAIKKQAADEANNLSSQASSIKAEADKKRRL
jgi:gas vesicle protein